MLLNIISGSSSSISVVRKSVFACTSWLTHFLKQRWNWTWQHLILTWGTAAGNSCTCVHNTDLHAAGLLYSDCMSSSSEKQVLCFPIVHTCSRGVLNSRKPSQTDRACKQNSDSESCSIFYCRPPYVLCYLQYGVSWKYTCRGPSCSQDLMYATRCCTFEFELHWSIIIIIMISGSGDLAAEDAQLGLRHCDVVLLSRLFLADKDSLDALLGRCQNYHEGFRP